MDANRLRAKMAEKGVTQGETARAVKMSENSLSRKLKGEREFRLSEVERLCEYLGIDNPAPIFLPKTSQMRNGEDA